MKILLIYPGWTNEYYSRFNPARLFSHKYSIFPPLNLAYLASVAINSGYEVEIFDGELNNASQLDYFNLINKKISKFASLRIINFKTYCFIEGMCY